MNLQSEIERVLNESFSEGSKTTHSIVTAEIMELIKRAEIDKKERDAETHAIPPAEKIAELDYWMSGNVLDYWMPIYIDTINQLVQAHNKHYD